MSAQTKILLAEDDAAQATLLSLDLRRRDLAVTVAKSEGEAQRALATDRFDVVVTDLRLGEGDGLKVLQACKREQPEAEVILITGHGSIDTAVAAIKAGAFDYLTKPIDPDELALLISKAVEHQNLVGELKRLREEVKGKYSFDGIVYASPKTQQVLHLVQKVAATDATVLVQGESGTGKELIARAIHEKSPRRAGTFVAINCGALPEGLLESELFGHVKGSFTGADRNKRGLFEEASGGTLFLDEISETTPALQVKLLRALQEGEIRRVGDNHPIRVTGRLVAATNRDLAKHVAEGKFREDLYYRLKVFPILLPPLRERTEDILPLAEHFIRKSAKKSGGKPLRLLPEAAALLMRYAWPGNVRELEHTIERALIMASGESLRADDLPPELHSTGEPAPTSIPPKRRTKAALDEESLDVIEKRHILAILKECNSNQKDAAKRLGIGRNTLWRKLKAFGIEPQRD